MSVAFTKEEDTEAAAAYLPERPISPHPNLVTESGLAQLDAALASAKEAVALAQTNADLKTDRTAMSRARRDLRYFTARRASAQFGEDEADAAQGTISHISPIAKALLGKRIGDIAALNESELEVFSVE